MSENLSTEFPKPPELQPLQSLQAKAWKIASFFLIVGGLTLMGWGGWLFYRQQAEIRNPPARVLEVSVEDLETPTSQPGPTATKLTATPQKLSGDVSTAAPAGASPSDSAPMQAIVSAEDSAMAAEPALEAEAVSAESTQPEDNTTALAEARFLEETALARETALAAEPPGEAVPSLADNPLVVAEDSSASADPDSISGNAATAASLIPTRIVAESIGLDAPVIQVGWKQVIQNGVPTNVWVVADYAAGWHQNSMLPGQGGNIVLSGHHNIKGEVFRYIVDLEPGDTVSLYVGDQRYDYTVDDKFIVKDKGEPDAVRRANARWIGPFNEERLTLVTCWPYNNNTHRLIVIARPV